MTCLCPVMLLASQDQAGRKLHQLATVGAKFLAVNKPQVDANLARFGYEDDHRFAKFISVKRAMLTLRATVRLRLRGHAATAEQIQAVVDALDAAAKTIERI